jgi:hypothetical protein
MAAQKQETAESKLTYLAESWPFSFTIELQHILLYFFFGNKDLISKTK